MKTLVAKTDPHALMSDAARLERLWEENVRLRAIVKEHDDLAKIDEDLKHDSNWTPRLRAVLKAGRDALSGADA